MERRDFVVGMATATAVAMAGSAVAQDHSQQSHGAAAANQGLVNTSNACISAGENCQTLCQEVLAQGDKSMAACAASVRQMLALCSALLTLAAQNAPALPKLAAVCADGCKACQAECEKHKEHPQCKACADACVACYNECKKVA
jgi:Cys-rich four helix bundle protein (predicted Tat secretion target)